jgi:predicted amidohydrolase YtcJ
MAIPLRRIAAEAEGYEVAEAQTSVETPTHVLTGEYQTTVGQLLHTPALSIDPMVGGANSVADSPAGGVLMRRILAGVVALGILGGTGVDPPAARAGVAPNLIVHDAVVLTMNPEMPSASAIAIFGDRIVAVGSDAEVLPLADPGTTIVDLDGLTVTPGFIDSHAHWLGDSELYGVATRQEAIQMALESGWTSLNELFVNQERLDALTALDAAGELRVRVNAYMPVNFGLDQKFGFWFSDLTPGAQVGPRLRLAGAKFFIDGCGPETYYLSEPRDDGNLGEFNWRRRNLRRLVARIHDAGWQIAAHSCGDGATDEILNALDLAFGDEPGAQFRARIEHLIVLRDDQLRRMRRLGVSPSIQLTFVDTEWLPDLRQVFDRQRLDELFGRWRDIVDDPRLRSMGSTDTPYGEGPHLRPSSVMDALVQATTKRARPQDSVPRWMREQRLTVDQALRLLTTGGAYGVFAEDELGMLAPGMLADFVVLSEDPHAVPKIELERIDVLMVFVGGGLEVCAPAVATLCPS